MPLPASPKSLVSGHPPVDTTARPASWQPGPGTVTILHHSSPADNRQSPDRLTSLSPWIAFVGLALLQFAAFGISLGKVGIYLDERILLEKMHFAKHDICSLLTLLFQDPRIVVRPLEALHYGSIYALVHEKPFLYHLVNHGAELLTAWFLYLGVSLLLSNRALALCAAALYILYPSHDATHYAIVESSISISMAFFTASIWLMLKGLVKSSYQPIRLGAFCYLLSLANYELCLPFALCYPFIAWGYCRRSERPFKASEATSITLHYAGAAACFVAYRQMLLWLNTGWGYPTTFVPGHMVKVLLQGIYISLFPLSCLNNQVSWQQAAQLLHDWWHVLLLLLCAAAGAATGLIKAPQLPRQRRQSSQFEQAGCWLRKAQHNCCFQRISQRAARTYAVLQAPGNEPIHSENLVRLLQDPKAGKTSLKPRTTVIAWQASFFVYVQSFSTGNYKPACKSNRRVVAEYA